LRKGGALGAAAVAGAPAIEDATSGRGGQAGKKRKKKRPRSSTQTSA
jgi:hypothetical protein